MQQRFLELRARKPIPVERVTEQANKFCLSSLANLSRGLRRYSKQACGPKWKGFLCYPCLRRWSVEQATCDPYYLTLRLSDPGRRPLHRPLYRNGYCS